MPGLRLSVLKGKKKTAFGDRIVGNLELKMWRHLDNSHSEFTYENLQELSLYAQVGWRPLESKE